ncbi:MAG: HEAT repeat domain-containing protein [Pontiellaceae bacterium]|nr:HEAT repeat domain-containing protein [Pontiellaceae bacterium]
MKNPKKSGAILGILMIIIIGVANMVNAQQESVRELFEKSLIADPDDYTAFRDKILSRAQDALTTLKKSRDNTSNWYEKSIAESLILAITRPEKYNDYQEEFDKGASIRAGYPIEAESWSNGIIVNDGSNAVPFLIEKMFKELPKIRPVNTVVPTYSNPEVTARSFLQVIGGNDAARAIAVSIIAFDNPSSELQRSSHIDIVNRMRQECPRLSGLSDNDLVTAMIKLVKKDSFLPTAAWVLGEFRDERAIGPLIESLTDYNVAKCSNSATALAKFGESALPALIEALGAPKRETGSWAESALTKMGAVAVPALSTVLSNEPGVAQEHAVRALRFIGDSRAVPVLIKSLENRNIGVVEEAAATALGELEDPSAIEPLIRALENPRNWSSSSLFGITGALAAFKEPDAFPRLSVLAKDEDWLVRRAAIKALPAVGGKNALPVLLELTHHEHRATRGDAVVALGELCDSRAVPSLIEALSDPEEFVFSWAAWSLGEIGDSRALPHLQKMASQTEGNTQRIAQEAIQKITKEELESK